jgi:hypothetical protein
MSKLILGLFLLAGTTVTSVVRAQDKKSLDSVDRILIARFITPAEQKAGDQEPQWATIALQIKASYSDTQADRAITKAQIYYYYGKNWPLFEKALVHYTVAYEDKEDGPLMNKNANFVLAHSTDQGELKTALAWVKHASDKEPSNADYKATCDAIQAKLIPQ